MIDTILEYAINNWPGITIVGILLVLFVIVAWRASKYHYSIQYTKEKVDNLPCEAHTTQLNEVRLVNNTVSATNKIVSDHTERLRDINTDLDLLQKAVTSTNELIVEIGRWISGRDKKMINTFVRKNSPYVITGIGKQLLEESGGKKAMDDNIDFFMKELEIINPKTPYDVEDQSINTVFRNMGNEIFNPVKNFIYYSPDKMERIDPDTGKTREIEISFPVLLNVMGIYLRDKYMERHPDIEDMPELKPYKP
ncbi:MAG TPA: hypothetical protein DEQ30_04990 [Porphyromonadaceae bacterium]|nr:hypothetical protein [Porphyromonadaceae bacterium]